MKNINCNNDVIFNSELDAIHVCLFTNEGIASLMGLICIGMKNCSLFIESINPVSVQGLIN